MYLMTSSHLFTHCAISYVYCNMPTKVLGAALIANKSMKSINLANNGIDAVGAFTILVGSRENPTLSSLNLDGNPVGEEGGRMLVKVAASDGHRLDISAANCDFTISTANLKFKAGGDATRPFSFITKYNDYCIDSAIQELHSRSVESV